MSKNLQQCFRVLTLVSKIKSKKLQNAILHEINCDDEIHSAVNEMGFNAIKGRIPLSIDQKKKLRRQKRFFKNISCEPFQKGKKNKKCAITKAKKRDLVNQSGGFLAVATPIIASLLAELLNKATS